MPGIAISISIGMAIVSVPSTIRSRPNCQESVPARPTFARIAVASCSLMAMPGAERSWATLSSGAAARTSARCPAPPGASRRATRATPGPSGRVWNQGLILCASIDYDPYGALRPYHPGVPAPAPPGLAATACRPCSAGGQFPVSGFRGT